VSEPAPCTVPDLDELQRRASGGRTGPEHAVFIVSTCHSKAGLIIAYDAGILHAMCARCRRVSLRFAIAGGDACLRAGGFPGKCGYYRRVILVIRCHVRRAGV